MDGALRVALVVPEYRTALGAHGGLSTVADFLRRAFEEAGWATVVLSPRTSSRAAESRRLRSPWTWLRPVTLERRADGVINVGAALAELEPVRYLPRPALTRTLDSCDVVVIVAGSPAIAHVARTTRRPVVMHVATMVSVERRSVTDGAAHSRFRQVMTSVIDRMDKAGMRVPDRVVTMNPWMTEQATKLGAARPLLAPPGVDTEVFRPPRKRVGRHLLAVARLSDPRKDLATLLRAYSRARELGVRLPLKIAGSGSLPSPIDDLVSTLGLRDHVDVEADISQTHLVELYQQAALMVLSSTEEGLGLVLLEAMACATPVLSTRTEGALHVVGSSPVGELVEIGDHESLGEAIARWMADPAGRTQAGEAARARTVSVFSLASAGRALVEVVRETARDCATKKPQTC